MTKIIHTHSVFAGTDWFGDFPNRQMAEQFVKIQKDKIKGAGLRENAGDKRDGAASTKLNWTIRDIDNVT